MADPIERLVAAFVRGDRLELSRAGWRLGAAAIGPELASPDRARALAALAVAPHANDAWALLVPLAAVARGPDRSRAVAASRAGAEIAGTLDAGRALILDIPADALDDSLRAWREIAADPGRWSDVRVDALTAARALASAVAGGELGFDAPARIVDDEPEVRRAALELLPQPLAAEHRGLAAARVREDSDPDVAAVAAQALCGGLAAGDEPAPVLESLGAEGLARVRALVIEPPGAAPAEVVIDAALCAVAAGDRDSLRALARFRGQLDGGLREILDARRAWIEAE